MENTEVQYTCEPPSLPVRNAKGLFENVNYVFLPNGKVDWRKMIPNEYLAVNKDRSSETDVTKVPEEHLLILLEGIHFLLNLRGFTVLDNQIAEGSTPEFAAASCKITWLPNYEEENRVLTSSSTASAHRGNVDSQIAEKFLTTIAENRAFVRAVRRFLRIPILGKDELGSTDPNESSPRTEIPEGVAYLSKILFDNNIKFESFKNRMIKAQVEGAENWLQITDVGESVALELAEKVKSMLEERAKRNKAAEAAKQ